MKHIEAAFCGVCGKDPQRRTSERTGRDWANFSVCVGEDDAAQWLEVVCFGPAVEAAMTLVKGDRVYAEGKLSLRKWDQPDGTTRTSLSVVASLVQPMGKIGERKPKKTTAAKAKAAGGNSAAVHKPLGFNDELPI